MPPDRGQISQMLAQIMAALGQGGAQGAGLGQAPSMTSGVAPEQAPAPVTDLSTQAQNPGILKTMGNNFMAGKGILGNQQGSPPMLAKILRSMQ